MLAWGLRTGLRVGAWLAAVAGFVLLTVPTLRLNSQGQALMQEKIVSELGGSIPLAIIASGLLLGGAALRRTAVRLRQNDNDAIATAILQRLREDPVAPVPEFFLYLRAFETTGRLRVPLYLRLRKLSVGAARLVTNDVESYVSTAVRRIAPLIALGRPGEAIGAGRIVTDDAAWKGDVLTLMRRARAILLVPSSRPGTLWEIETLQREGLWSKVVFIMPPRTKGDLDSRERWEEARRAMAAEGLEAPEYQERGLLFEVGIDGRVTNVEPMLLNSARQVRKSMRRLLSADPPRGGLYRAIAIAYRRTRRAAALGWLETGRQLAPYPLIAIALFVPAMPVGFDPRESWSMVVDRSSVFDSLDEHDARELQRLSESPAYLALEADVPAERIDEFRADLRARGLQRLPADAARAYFKAIGEMLDRVDTSACAAIARGTVSADAMRNAFSYIPPSDIDAFLQARTDALLAEAEGSPVAELSPDAIDVASGQFVATLDRDAAARYARLNEADALSDEDLCWMVRTVYAGVARLDEPYATVWAQTLAAAAAPEPREPVAAAQQAEPAPAIPAR